MTAFVSAESIQLRPTQSLADNVSFLESLEREFSVSDKPGERRLQLNVRCDSTVPGVSAKETKQHLQHRRNF